MIGYGTDYPDPFAPVVPQTTPPTGAVTVRLSDVEPEHVSWQWAGRLPLGKIVVLDGDPAVGKSTISVDLAARVSTGSTWPDGAPNRKGAVLLLSAEDGLADTIRPRLDAAGGDPTKVHALTEVRYHDEDGNLRTRPVTLSDLEHIEKAVTSTSATLIVVDVLMAFLPGKVDAHRDQDVRGVLSGLAAMAERTNSCVLLLRHLNKSTGGPAIYRGGGSIGIVGAARVGLLAAADPDDESQRVLAGIKSNLSVMPEALSYKLVDSPEHGCARVEWLGTSAHSAGALLAAPRDEDDEEGDELVEMLRLILDESNGEISAADATKRLRGFGSAPSKGTLHRARKRAGIVSQKADFGGGWVWRYTSEGSGQRAQGSEGSGSPRGGTFGTFAESSTRDSRSESAPAGAVEHATVIPLHPPDEQPDVDVTTLDWIALGIDTVTTLIVDKYHVDSDSTRETVAQLYRRVRGFHDPNTMYFRAIKLIAANCGHALEGVNSNNGKCSGCVIAGMSGTHGGSDA